MQQKLLWGCVWPREGFFAESSGPSTAANSGPEGTRWYQAARQRVGAQMPSVSACVLSSGGLRGITGSLTNSLFRTLARGRVLHWLRQLGRSVWRGEIKMGKHGRSHSPKEINTHTRHTNNHCSFTASWKAALAAISRSFCHIHNTQKQA